MTMSEAEILWASAAVSIVEKVGEPNLQPLVSLLRSDLPITPAARDMLAALIDPDGEGFLRLRLRLEPTSTKRNNMSKDIKKLLIWHEYNDRMQKGESSEDIADDLRKKNSCSDRTIYNCIKDIENLRSWLSGDE
jgi:DNA-directed RNA polymerase subunit N (RpoN/RPB10)